MKILILSFYYYPDLSAGSFRTTALVKKLLKRGANVEIITSMPNRYSSFKPDALNYENTKNLTIHRIDLPSHKSGMADQIKAFVTYYRQANKILFNKKYDLIFATSSRLFTAFLGARISRKKNIPLYLDIRDIFTDSMKYIMPKFLSLFILPILIMIERYTFNTAKKINIVSKGFLDFLENRYRNLDYSFFTNGIDDEFIDLNKQHQFKSSNKKKKLKILYAGNVGTGQCLHKIMPRMAAASMEVSFKVIGDGGQIAKLKNEVKVQKIENIEILPPTSRTNLIKEYMMADVLFMHLDKLDCYERVLPSKIFEYSATGKPILAGLSGFSLSFVESEIDNCEVFEPRNATMAINKLSKLKIQNTNREKFIKKYSRDKIMIDMSEDIYKCCKSYTY